MKDAVKDKGAGAVVHDFARAISPVSPETFFAEYFEKKHLVIKRDQPDYYRDLLTIEDIDHVITQTMVPSANLQLVNNGNGIDVDDFTMPNGYVDPVRVSYQFARGSTVILPQLHRSLPKLSSYCRSLETVFSCDLQTNIYLTPDNAQGFKTHYDSHDVIVLQAHGSKTWKIYESPLELPLRSQAFDPKTFQAGKVIETFVLNAGDMAYIPRGVVHDAIATDEVSLHITTGLLASRWVDVLVEAIVERALQDPALRASIPPGFANDGFDKAGALETFAALMARAVEGCDPQRTLDGFAHEFRRRRLPVVPGQFLQSNAADAIGAGCAVSVRPGLIYTLSRRAKGDAEEVILEVYGAEIAFPGFAEESLRAAMTLPQFTVGDLPGDLDEAGQAVLARRLVREGVMFRV
ncbi:cupin domain-containing protein [Pararhodobacter sp.]|uniref:cupin domain-containing protein n=1 Tax=Pararhodobacter sp. TaxID=2127056 RepID=UPI002B0030BE|nr:cupin domain-containing protein [Pararhodobacter sp.]